jgi:GNAT superfamily N-acetyltransferase
MDLSIRPADDRDLPTLRGLFRRSSLSNDGDRAHLLAAPDALRWVGAGIAAGQTQVATDRSGRILGFVTVVGIEGGLEVEDLFVEPDAMRRGVATRLLLDAAGRAEREGATWMEVTANPHAAAFYASVGFVPVGEEQTLFGPAPRLRRQVATGHPSR